MRKEREKAEKTGEIPKEVYIAGDIGPIPEQDDGKEAPDILEEYRTIAKAHLDSAGGRVDQIRQRRVYHGKFFSQYVWLYKNRNQHERTSQGCRRKPSD